MSRIGTLSRRLLGVAVVALVMLLVVESVVLAATFNKNGGPVTAVRTVTDTGTSPASVDPGGPEAIPGMSLTVTVPEGERALLIVTFAAVSKCIEFDADTASCYVRVRVDDTYDPPPGIVIFDSDTDGENGVESNSMQWVSGPVSAGPHTVRVDYWVDGNDSLFTVYQRTLTVLRVKV